MKAIVDASSLLLMIKNVEEEALLDKLEGLATLDLAFYEIGNALWKQVVRGVASREEVERTALAIGKLLLVKGVIKVGWRDLGYSAILNLAVDNGITFYDASYLAASIAFGVPLITEDEKLRRVAAKYVEVASWRDF
ncbi:MAG: type II toxin-antitoxin system VapC family toxin [Thermofilum sp.]